ncbi:MAG: hypothetical protein OXB93_03410 [Cytophagales bacterium]|nr:hypothetical protein [Cytophagales bacterium]
MEENWIGYIDSLLAYHLGIQAQELSDRVWAEKFKQLMDIRNKEKNSSARD